MQNMKKHYLQQTTFKAIVDDEDMELAMYYRKMYEQKVKKFRGRRSAVRHLAVSRL